MNETSTSKKDQIKNGWKVISALVLLLGLAMIFIINQTKVKDEPVLAPKFSDATAHAESQPIVLERAQREIAALSEKNADLQKKLDVELSKQAERTNELNARINQLEAEKSYRQPVQSYNHQRVAVEEIHEPIDTSIQEIKISLSKKEVITNPKKNVDTYVPAGTFVKAVMLGGADASAAVQSQAILSPMVFRIIENGTLPNHKKSHLKNCFVTGAVFGDISSERGLIRTEQVSCVFPNGQILDTKVDGAIFGPEGKNGVRGIPLWRENALLQRAFAAGALSGLAEGIANTYSTQSVSPEGVVTAIKNGKVFQNAGAKGIGKAMEKLADYNIQRAEQYHPVIQISAGTVVDVVFLKGFYLDDEANSTREGERALFKPIENNFWGLSGDIKRYEELRGAG